MQLDPKETQGPLLLVIHHKLPPSLPLAESLISMSSEISHALRQPQGIPAIDLSKKLKLIEYVGLDVVRFRRDQQVAYRMVDHCRETYDRNIGVVEIFDWRVDEEADFDQFTRYSDTVGALEE